jgi:hypothetical protein
MRKTIVSNCHNCLTLPSTSSFVSLFVLFVSTTRPRKTFPITGKPPKDFSNHWKIRPHFSNHWKNIFQSLENPRFCRQATRLCPPPMQRLHRRSGRPQRQGFLRLQRRHGRMHRHVQDGHPLPTTFPRGALPRRTVPVLPGGAFFAPTRSLHQRPAGRPPCRPFLSIPFPPPARCKRARLRIAHFSRGGGPSGMLECAKKEQTRACEGPEKEPP